MGQGPFGPPGMGPGDPQRDDYYRRLDEDRFLDSTRPRRDPLFQPDPDTDTSRSYISAQSGHTKIERLWVEQDHDGEDGKGLLIHMNLKKVNSETWVIAVAKFYSKDTNYDHGYGYAQTYGEDLWSNGEDSDFDDVTIYVPYEKLHLEYGSHELQCVVRIEDWVGNDLVRTKPFRITVFSKGK